MRYSRPRFSAFAICLAVAVATHTSSAMPGDTDRLLVTDFATSAVLYDAVADQTNAGFLAFQPGGGGGFVPYSYVVLTEPAGWPANPNPVLFPGTHLMVSDVILFGWADVS